MNRPLRYDGSGDTINLREMTDANLERLVYYTQVAYATQLHNSGKGYIYSGSGATSIGSHQDTLTNPNSPNTRAAPTDGIIQTHPGSPGISSINGINYTYRQDRTVPSFPNTSTLDTNSYLYLDGSYDIKVETAESEIISSIINAALTQLKSGNEVGSYRVSTGTPSSGGAGTWTDKGTWFIDKYYQNNGNVTYKLYLKRSLTTIPGSNILPLKLSSNDLREHSSITDTSDLVQNVLLPTMTRRLSTGTSLCYEVVSSAPTGAQARGTVTNKRFTSEGTPSQTTEGSGANEVYVTSATINTSGTRSLVSTRYLKYLG